MDRRQMEFNLQRRTIEWNYLEEIGQWYFYESITVHKLQRARSSSACCWPAPLLPASFQLVAFLRRTFSLRYYWNRTPTKRRLILLRYTFYVLFLFRFLYWTITNSKILFRNVIVRYPQIWCFLVNFRRYRYIMYLNILNFSWVTNGRLRGAGASN